MRSALLLVPVAVAVLFQAPKPSPTAPDPKTLRPIEAVDTVFIEDMTWMEVRDEMKAGKDTVIVATGGIEQNGPYLAANKHNVVLRATTDAIARKLVLDWAVDNAAVPAEQLARWARTYDENLRLGDDV